MNIFQSLSDNYNLHSLANHFRQKRFVFFRELVSPLERPLTILDVGGTQTFWEHMGFADEPGIEFTLVNIVPVAVTRTTFRSICADARDLSQFQDREFDIVFSNSVIEHVGDFTQQERMAKEIRRVGKRYFLQTPNYYFPLEPHFLVPGFQFLPRALRILLIQRYNLGWVTRASIYEEAQNIVDSVQLLSKRQLLQLFPNTKLYTERSLGLSKSFTVYGGW